MKRSERLTQGPWRLPRRRAFRCSLRLLLCSDASTVYAERVESTLTITLASCGSETGIVVDSVRWAGTNAVDFPNVTKA